jgi:Mg-chelatase subunit ChlD
MEKDRVYNLIILDESGSMESIKTRTVQGFNELVQTIRGIQRQFTNQQHFISLVTFNGLGIKTKLHTQPVSELTTLDEKSYHPDASTPLYDAMAKSILQLKHEIYQQSNTSVLVTTITDGEENASKEFSGKEVKLLIEDLQTKGWTFTYMGANHDVTAVADRLSIPKSNVMAFSADEESVTKMFALDKKARVDYSGKVHSGAAKSASYFREESEEKPEKS